LKPLIRALVGLMAFQAGRRLLSLLRHPAARRHLRSDGSSSTGGDDTDLYVIVPMLDESEVFHETLEFFTEFVEKGSATLVLVTSDREYSRNPQGSARDTARLAGLAARDGVVVHLHVADEAAVKADQDNVAVRMIAARTSRPEATLVVIYDVDSRPAEGSFEEFAVRPTKEAKGNRWPTQAEGHSGRVDSFTTGIEL